MDALNKVRRVIAPLVAEYVKRGKGVEIAYCILCLLGIQVVVATSGDHGRSSPKADLVALGVQPCKTSFGTRPRPPRRALPNALARKVGFQQSFAITLEAGPSPLLSQSPSMAAE